MKYWWVNQKRTFRHEVGGGYLWSPKLQSNGTRHFSYEFMKKVSPGDVIFSYAKTAIGAVGVARTHCYSFPKPTEFGAAGSNWLDEGWKVDIAYRRLDAPVRTMDHVSALRDLLPRKFSPLKPDTGGANQAYLFEINQSLALALAHLIDRQTIDLVQDVRLADKSESFGYIDENINEWEQQLEKAIRDSTQLSITAKTQLVEARRGQGKFRELLLEREIRCRVTGVDKQEHLIASHIKPWRSSSDRERLDPENGFMLTPSIDHLFDKGFISFENNGSIVLADVSDRKSMEKFGVIGADAPDNIGNLSDGQKTYLNWHRESLFLG